MTITDPTASLRRSPDTPAEPAIRQLSLVGWLFLVLPALLVDLGFGLRKLGALRDGQLINPDSYMRLVRIKEMLAVGHPVETVANDASGLGFVLHWSHLLDAVLLLLAAPLTVFVSWPRALLAVSDVMGPLQVAGLAVAVAWAARPFVARSLLPLAAPLIVLAPGTLSYALPGVVHHHIPALTIVVVVTGLAARAALDAATPGRVVRTRHGLAIGLWSSLGIWLTPEIMPLLAAVFGLLYVGWLSLPAARGLAGALRDAGVAFFLSTGCVIALDPPYGGILAPAMDRVSVVLLGVAGVAAATGFAVSLIDRPIANPGPRLLVSGAAGMVAGAIWFLVFRTALLGPSALGGDPGLDAMHPLINELMPVDTISGVLMYLVPGICGTVLLAGLALRRRSAVLAYGAAVSLVMLLAAQRHVRFTCYPDTLGVVALLAVLSLLERPTVLLPGIGRAAVRLTSLASLVLLQLLGVSLTARAGEASASSCNVTHLDRMLAPYAGQVVLSHVDAVPELLYRTDVRTVASLYLRNGAAWLRMQDLWWGGPSASVPPGFAAARVALVLFCKRTGRADPGSQRLVDRLGRGDVPAWLQQVASDPASGNVLYEVAK